MSGLEERCLQFHEAALGTGKTKEPSKEIATLRKFLHKNQTQRFSDKATSRVFDTIQVYCSHKEVSPDEQEALLEDALKMPFTVFTTKQKKTMLKWINDIRGNKTRESASTTKVLVKLTVIDANETAICLFNEETGDTYEDLSLPDGVLRKTLLQAFKNTEDAVDVEATITEGSGQPQITIERLCKLS
jgi:hypothetical protein